MTWIERLQYEKDKQESFISGASIYTAYIWVKMLISYYQGLKTTNWKTGPMAC